MEQTQLEKGKISILRTKWAAAWQLDLLHAHFVLYADEFEGLVLWDHHQDEEDLNDQHHHHWDGDHPSDHLGLEEEEDQSSDSHTEENVKTLHENPWQKKAAEPLPDSVDEHGTDEDLDNTHTHGHQKYNFDGIHVVLD